MIRRLLVNRLMVFGVEASALLLGIVLSAALADAPASFLDEDYPVFAIFFAGLFLTFFGFRALRQETRPWRIQCEAVGWDLARVERRLHPNRARFKRIALRVVVWAPSLLAAFALFFLPAATHLLHPRSQYLPHYRIPIPWNLLVFSSADSPPESGYVFVLGSEDRGGLGFQPFWKAWQFSSRFVFGSIRLDADTFEFNHHFRDLRRGGAVMVSKREFRLGDAPFTCWQYVNQRNRNNAGATLWDIDCETPPTIRKNNLYATFVGRPEDIPVFYSIVEGIAPVK